MKLIALFSVLLYLVLTVVASTADEHVKVLTADTFYDTVGGGQPVLVEFYAPWCGHCKSLAPIYEQLAKGFSHLKSKVIIAKIDADEHKDIGSTFGIQGFPTLKWFPAKSTTAEDYPGQNDLLSLKGYVEAQTGLKAKRDVSNAHVVELTSGTFESVVGNSSVSALVEFYAPWCGHCKQLAPIYEQVARDYSREPGVVIAALDATAASDIAGNYDVNGYPTIKLFKKGDLKNPDTYDQGRTEGEFVAYLNRQLGLQRVEGGGLSPRAGLIPELNEVLRNVLDSTKEKRKELFAVATKIADKLDNKYVPFYVRMIAKLIKLEQPLETYLTKEIDRLSSIISSGSVAADKLDNFFIRRNILNMLRSGSAHSDTNHEEL